MPIDHQSARNLKDEWITPRYITSALGPFDLDPCAPVSPPWPISGNVFTMFDDGLKKPWRGFVWLNPPYGKETGKWLARLGDHGNGIALIMARTETKMFFDHVWNIADAVFFFRGRIHFHHVDGSRAAANAGAPSCLVCYGKNAISRVKASGLDGHLLLLANKNEVDKNAER